MTGRTPVEGGCACGSVRIAIDGEPLRVGLCHCLTCRKLHCAPFNAFATFATAQVRVSGATAVFRSSEAGRRHYCPGCGSHVFATYREGEIEAHLGALDEPGSWAPTYELWTIRREPWLPDLPGVVRYERDRPAPARSETPRSEDSS